MNSTRGRQPEQVRPLRGATRSLVAAGLGALCALGMAAGAPPAAASKVSPGGAPQGIVEMAVQRESGVVSAWLGNGVRVHHRRMSLPGRGMRGMGGAGQAGRSAESPAGAAAAAAEARVVVTIALAGGELLETEATRGLTFAALSAWRKPAMRSADAAALAARLREHRIQIGEYSTGDAMVLRVEAPASELGEALRVAAGLITEPVVQADVVAEWARYTETKLETPTSHPRWVISEALREAMVPALARPLSRERLASITAAEAQGWLDGLLASSPPVEVAIVGEIEVADAMRAVEAALGALPARERISTGTLAGRRPAARGDRPADIREQRAIDGGRAIAGAGFFGTDDIDLRTHRALTLAALVLDERLTTRVRERGWGGMSDVLTTATPGGFSPGASGVILPAAFVEPRHAAAAEELVAGLIAEFLAHGPTEDELRRAREMTVRDVGRTMSSPWYWSAVLARATYRGYTADELIGAVATLEGLTAAEIMETVRRHARPERTIRMVIEPAP